MFCLSRLISETTDESFQLLDLVALVAVCRLKLRLALLALRQVLLEIAAIELNAFVPDLNRLLDGHVKEVAIMGDENECIRIRCKIILKPVARLEIEMIRRLV